MKLLATISSALAGSPGIDFYLNDGDYWPIGACSSDKACSAWRISTKPGWEKTWAANLKCDLSVEKCTCADGWVDLDGKPENGCESKAGESLLGGMCYYSSCFLEDKCNEFHPGLVCSKITGCCECEGEEPLRPTIFGQNKGCLDKNCPEGAIWDKEIKWCLCEDGRLPQYNLPDLDDSVCCPPGLWGNPCGCSNGVIPDLTAEDPCDPGCPENLYWDPNTKRCECPGNLVYDPSTGRCECPEGMLPGVTGNCFCPTGTYEVTGVEPTKCCPFGTWYNPQTERCEENDHDNCPPNMYTVPNVIPHQCCPDDSVWDPVTQECDCPEGHYLTTDPLYVSIERNVCCPDGTVYIPSLDSCDCPNGSYAVPDESPTQCCPDGSQWQANTRTCECPEGTYLTTDDYDREVCCPEGTKWIPHLDRCDCPPGTYAASINPIRCCPDGYNWNEDFNDCVPDEGLSHCPEGTYAVAGITPLQCCPEGTEWDHDKNMCVDPSDPTDPTGSPCPEGTYPVAGTNPVECCPEGSHWDFEKKTCLDPTDPVDCPPGHYPVAGTDPVECCPDGTHWDFEKKACVDPVDPIEKCPEGTYQILGIVPLQCCKIGTFWDPDREICGDPTDPVDPIEECPKGFYQVAGVTPLQCCPEGTKWIPELKQCMCPDGSDPVAGQFPPCEDPEQCPKGTYLVEFVLPQIVCCPLGTKYVPDRDECLCPDGNPVDDLGLCVDCPEGEYAVSRFPELICCPEGTWFDKEMKECLCPDKTKPDENGDCVDPSDKCLKPLKYDFITGMCVCWNGEPPLEGEATVPVDEFGCPPNDCPEGQNAFFDKEGNLQCCREGLVYNFQKDTCVCKDGTLPTATGDCGSCEKWQNAFYIEDKIICCGVNEYYAADHKHCMCTDGTHVEKCPFPCKDNEIHEVDPTGMSSGECIPMCDDGHVFNKLTKTCHCTDGRPIDEGYPGGCPPIVVDCTKFFADEIHFYGDEIHGQWVFVPWDTKDGPVCCHIEAHYNPEIGQCVCNDGSKPDERGLCGKSCPEELVFAPYPPTGEMACLCPETFKFPNADGVCMDNPCEKGLNPFKLPDGSVACCPEGSYFDYEMKSCICFSTKQAPDENNECPEKCPEDTIPVIDDETGDLNCLAVDCAPGFYLAYKEICCREDKIFDKERFQCVCPPGLADFEGRCQEKCPLGSTFNGEECVSRCPEGQIFREGACYCALDGSLASLNKPCCEFGQSWDALKGICTCDGDLFCEKACPKDRPNLFIDKFGDRQCCPEDMVFDVINHACMCSGGFDKPAFKPLDGSCRCPDGERQMMNADMTSFVCVDGGCPNGLVVDDITSNCVCPKDSWQFINSIGVPVCCKRDQKWSEELQECICVETNLPALDDGTCEDLGDEKCPPGWTFVKETMLFNDQPVRCMPICPEPSIAYVKPLDCFSVVNPAECLATAAVECMCKGDYRYNGTADNMIDYILYGSCEMEECPPGLVRSDDILTFNECTCPYKWQKQIQTTSIPPQIMCTCDDPKYQINEETGMCECKPQIADYSVTGFDGSCDCPRNMLFNAEKDLCEEINTGTVVEIDENCWYYDFETEACLTKEEFENQFDAKPTENPFTQNDKDCPNFEVGWKGLKSSKIQYKSPTGYLILVNILNNQGNVDVTVDDYIGFIIFSKRYCGIDFIKELDNGNVTVSFYDKTPSYDRSDVYVRLDKGQSQTAIQFTTKHSRDAAGKPDYHLGNTKKDQFLLHVEFDHEIDFVDTPENCLTRFNIGVMKSEMDFTQDYTHCVANSLWWSAPVFN